MFPTIGHVERWADAFVDRLLDEEPAILLEGPRGSGKSTLLRSIAHRRNALVLDLDDDSVLQLVREDVGSALASPGLVAIDEFHRAPEVRSYVKRVVDRQGGTARFLLAGSVSSFLWPPGTETLTGRAHRLSLMPLAPAEVFGAKHRWLAELLSDWPPAMTSSRSAVISRSPTASAAPVAFRRCCATPRPPCASPRRVGSVGGRNTLRYTRPLRSRDQRRGRRDPPPRHARGSGHALVAVAAVESHQHPTAPEQRQPAG